MKKRIRNKILKDKGHSRYARTHIRFDPIRWRHKKKHFECVCRCSAKVEINRGVDMASIHIYCPGCRHELSVMCRYAADIDRALEHALRRYRESFIDISKYRMDSILKVQPVDGKYPRIETDGKY